MTRLLVHVEGQTEETFVDEVLAPHLLMRGYSRVAARLMGSARGRNRRGGIRSWPAARRDIVYQRPDLAPSFQAIVDHCGTPEEIDDSPDSAPSKRIEEILPAYQKPLHGNLAALEIGLCAMRSACPGFRRWLERLENPADSLSKQSLE